MYRHILLPTDGSELSARAVAEGIRLAQALGARVTALHVTPPFYPEGENPSGIAAQIREHGERSEAGARRALDYAERAAREAGVACAVLRKERESPWEEIIWTAASESCDLIFMASHGRRGVAGLVLGSETHKVLTHSKIPVLVVR
jgi:nucleotide-binding universal stress UspA family protein